MANISTLTVALAVNSAKLTAGLKKSSKSLRKWANKALKRVKSVGAGFTKFAGILSGLTFGAFILTINRSAEAIDKLAKASARIGIPIERLQQLRFVAEQSGLSVDAFDNSMQRMVKRVGKAASGLGLAKTAIEQLGLSAVQLGELSPDEMFDALRESILKIDNIAQQTQLSDAIFGPGFLNVVRANFAVLTKEYDALGVGITASQAKAVEAFQDSKNKINLIFAGFGNNLTAEMAPALEKINEIIQEVIIEFGGVKNLAIEVGRYLVDAIVSGVEAFGWLIGSLQETRLWVINLEKGLLLVGNIWDNIWGDRTPETIKKRPAKKCQPR